MRDDQVLGCLQPTGHTSRAYTISPCDDSVCRSLVSPDGSLSLCRAYNSSNSSKNSESCLFLSFSCFPRSFESDPGLLPPTPAFSNSPACFRSFRLAASSASDPSREIWWTQAACHERNRVTKRSRRSPCPNVSRPVRTCSMIDEIKTKVLNKRDVRFALASCTTCKMASAHNSNTQLVAFRND